MPHFGGAPFFVLNSDSIWCETGKPALAGMQEKWDADSMDGLLLLAEMKTALGYDGTGDFARLPDGRVVRARERHQRQQPDILCLSRGADCPSAPV